LLDAQIRHSHRPSSTRCRGWATYAVDAEDDRTPDALLYLRGFPDGHSDREWSDLAAAGRVRGAAHLDEQDLIVWTFPADPALPALAELVDPARIVAHLPVAALRGRRVMAGDVTVDVIRYQPESSATLRCIVDGGEDHEPVTLYAKVLDTDPTPIGDVHDRLWARSAEVPALRIARPLGTDAGLRVLWTLGVPGSPLGSSVEAGSMASIARRVAVVVAALHGSSVAVARRASWEDYLAEGRKKAAKLGDALPRCRAVVDAIAPGNPRLPHGARPVVVHGDLHLDQFIDGPDGPALIDLDSVATGAAELDLAEVAVDVALRPLPVDAVGAFVLELLEVYERQAAPCSIDLGLLRALADAEFLTRCHRHLRRRAPGWQVELGAALARHGVLVEAVPT
jgi:Phosphotransferase enzyme family